MSGGAQYKLFDCCEFLGLTFLPSFCILYFVETQRLILALLFSLASDADLFMIAWSRKRGSLSHTHTLTHYSIDLWAKNYNNKNTQLKSCTVRAESVTHKKWFKYGRNFKCNNVVIAVNFLFNHSNRKENDLKTLLLRLFSLSVMRFKILHLNMSHST